MSRERSPFAPSRRHLGALLAAGAAMALPAVPAIAASQASDPDPTFSLIEAHRAAWEHFDAVVGEWSWTTETPPAEYEVRRDAASDAETEALEALLAVEPTTLAGLRALAEYMLAYDLKMNGTIYAHHHERWALETITEACRKLIPEGRA